jgi:hypothetical protein
MAYARSERTIPQTEFEAFAQQWVRKGGTLSDTITYDSQGRVQRHIIDHGQRIHEVYAISDTPQAQCLLNKRLQTLRRYLYSYVLKRYERNGQYLHQTREGQSSAVQLAQEILKIPRENGEAERDFFLQIRTLPGFQPFQLHTWFADVTYEQIEAFLHVMARSRYPLRKSVEVMTRPASGMSTRQEDNGLWKAWFSDDPYHIWKQGKTQAEAIGNLVLSFPARVGKVTMTDE